MKAQYILLRKNKSEAKSVRIQSEVKTVLKEAAFCVENDIIYFSEDKKENYVVYRMSYEDNNTLYLDVSTQLRGESAAELLDEFNERLIKGNHRKKFYIINAYSDSSYLYCSKLMPEIGAFERLLREFIYLTITKVYGSEWIKTLNSEIINHVEEISHGTIKKKDSLIEETLEWLEFKEIETFLFAPCIFDVDEDSIINEILTNESLTKEEVLNQVKKLEKRSLWDRFFQEFSDVKDLQEEFNELRLIRNNVMHNKSISTQYFHSSKGKLKKINKQLEASINKIDKTIYDKPKDRRTIVFDGRIFVEAIFKSFDMDDELKKHAELGKRLCEKYASKTILDLYK